MIKFTISLSVNLSLAFVQLTTSTQSIEECRRSMFKSFKKSIILLLFILSPVCLASEEVDCEPGSELALVFIHKNLRKHSFILSRLLW